MRMAYSNYIFDLYGTLVDIHTDEEKGYLWEKMSMYMRFQGVRVSAVELKTAYHRAIDAQRLERWERIFAKPGTEHFHGEMQTSSGKEQVNFREVAIFSGEGEISLRELEVSLEEVIRELYRLGEMEASDEQVRDWALMFRTISMEHLSLYEGAADLLKRLKKKGKKVFLLTNAQRAFTEPELRTLGILDCFDAVYYSSDIGFVKPSPYFYQKLLMEQKLDPKESVMVGNDDRADAWGAHENGLDSIYIYTRQSPERTQALPANCMEIGTISEVDRVGRADGNAVEISHGQCMAGSIVHNQV